MNPQSHALCHRANGLEQVLALRRARLRVHHHIGRNDFANALLDGITERVYLLKACCARHAHRGVHKVAVSFAAHPGGVAGQYTLHSRQRPPKTPLPAPPPRSPPTPHPAAPPPPTAPPE